MQEALVYTLEIREGIEILERVVCDAEVSHLGRDPSSEVHLNLEGVSRKHAQIRRDGERFILLDLGSKNGTLVNGRPVSSIELHDGDVIQIGEAKLDFRIKRSALGKRVSKVESTILLGRRSEGGADPQGETAEQTVYTASVRAEIFHKPNCDWMKSVSEERRIYFASRDEALRSGRRPCGSCNP